MREWAGKRYWLVGASEGLGLALARLVSGAGAEVVLSARSPEPLAAAVAAMPGRATGVPCDVGDSASVRAAAAAAGRLDGVIFLAGVYWPMRAQDWDADRAEAMCNINFTGCARVIGAVLPQMVAGNAGHIVVTGSLSGFRGLPGAIGYAASKAGAMVLAESLHADLRGNGVTVQVANPGFIRTRLTAKNDFAMPQVMEPEAAARMMFEHLCTNDFKLSFPKPFAWLFRGGQLMPDALWYGLFRNRP